MKKIIAALLMLALCLGLCACGALSSANKAEEIVLPTKPKIVLPDLPARGGSDETADENIEPTGETHPWDVEFNEADYADCDVHEERFNIGKTITWHESFMPRRQVTYYNSGETDDSYFYPSYLPSHSYHWWADGSYSEVHYLDNGYFETKEDGAIISHIGTQIYDKWINSDGSWRESLFNNDGILMLEIYQNTEGSSGETQYYDNGNVKHCRRQSPEYTLEEHYDEEGFHTYFYSKDADYELELTADESGKLIKVVENGEVKEDAATLTQYAQNYNFRQ